MLEISFWLFFIHKSPFDRLQNRIMFSVPSQKLIEGSRIIEKYDYYLALSLQLCQTFNNIEQ